MRRGIAMLFTLLLASILAVGCGGPSAGGDAKTIKVANYFADDHPQNVALREKFKPMVEAKTDLRVQIYGNSRLGAEKEFYDGVRNGTIEMGIPGMIMQADIPKMGIPELPFIFKDLDHAHEVLKGPLGEELTADLEKEHGVKALAWSANGMRMFSSNKPLRRMEDFRGFRLRMPNIPNYIAFGKALGANVTPMPISEVFTALEQGVVDGQDNPIATLRASGWYEVQSYVLESNHMFSPNLYIINSGFWNRLSPREQEVIAEAAKESAAYEWELLKKSIEEDKKFLKDQGIRFIVPDKRFRAAMEKAAEPIYQQFYREHPETKDLIERIRKTSP